MQIQEIIDNALADREPKEIKSWHASKLGYCLSGVYFERIGIQPLTLPDARLKRVFQCGNLFEKYVMEEMAKVETVEVEEQVRVESDELNVTGYIDCVIKFADGEMPVEFKSQNSRAFWYMVGDPKKGRAGEGAYPHHKMQLLMYMYINGYKVGKLVYISKDDLCIQEYVIDINDPLLQTALENVTKLNEALKTGVPPEPADEKTFQAKYCNWHDYCTGRLPLPVQKV